MNSRPSIRTDISGVPERAGRSLSDPLLKGNQCLCRACNQYFRSVTAFEKHRVGTFHPLARRCLTVTEMLAAGMEQRGPYWISEPYSGPQRGSR
jgi:hypothetical protein